MTGVILAVARQEVRTARTNRLAMLLIGIFIGMVIVSGFIGWATHHTISSVYREALREGATSAPDPLSAQQPLDLIRNTVIYVILIGALSAILLGVRSTEGDRKAGVVDLIFSRPVTSRQYATGKLLGIQLLTGFILMIAALVSWMVMLLISGRGLSLADTGDLMLFFVLAWLFLFPFSALGFILGAISRRETSALLVPILVWALLVFVIPQLGTAEHPVSLLNPVLARPVSQGPFFALSRRVLQPVSVTDRFRSAGAGLLRIDGADTQSHILDWLSLAGIAAGSCAAAMFIARREIMRRPFLE